MLSGVIDERKMEKRCLLRLRRVSTVGWLCVSNNFLDDDVFPRRFLLSRDAFRITYILGAYFLNKIYVAYLFRGDRGFGRKTRREMKIEENLFSPLFSKSNWQICGFLLCVLIVDANTCVWAL